MFSLKDIKIGRGRSRFIKGFLCTVLCLGFVCGVICADEGEDREKEIAAYKAALEKDPSDLDAKEGLGLEYVWADMPGKAKPLLIEVLAEDPGRGQARKALEHINSVREEHNKTAHRHEHVTETIKHSAHQLDTYNKMAEEYLHASAYEKAKEYYKDVLKLDPGNVRAQKKLDEVQRLMRPQIFAQMDLFDIKGGAEMLAQTYGASVYLEDGYSMEADCIIKRRTEQGKKRYVRQIVPIEISKAFTDELILLFGAKLKYYGSDEQAILDYSVNAVKSIGHDLSVNMTYSKEHQDATRDMLEQRVDKHGVVLGMHCNITERFSLSADAGGAYYTEGYAPDNNANFTMSISPIIHVMKTGPVMDLSYTYYQIDFLRKSITVDGEEQEYEYYSPKAFVSHSGTVYLSHAFFDKRVKAVFSDTISYRPHDRSARNTIYTELRYKITGNDNISAVFVRNRAIANVKDSYQITQQLTVKFSHSF